MSDFVAEVGNKIARACIGTGFLPSVIIAQAILESSWGKSGLTVNYNNLFGLKAGTKWTGKTVDLRTGEVFDGQSVFIIDAFRVYDNYEKSISDRISWMRETSRYSNVETLDTPELQANELQNAGYATDPNYANKLKQLISDYNLIQYDKNEQTMKTINIVIAGLLFVVAILIVYKTLQY